MKQITFPRPMECTHVYLDGRQERVRYGYFEAIQIIKMNGWDFNQLERGTVTLAVHPLYYVTEVIKSDGTKVIFDEPFFSCYKEEYGDGSGRKAVKIYG